MSGVRLISQLTAAAVAAATTASVLTARQGRADGPVAVTVAPVERLGDRLFRLAEDGYRVDVVATPDAPFLPANIVVLLSAAPAATTTEYKVVDDTSLARVNEQTALLADQGYVLRGFTAARPRFGTARGYVAVMERTPGSGPTREYRFILTRGTSQDWRVLERAAADGFTVTRTLVWPDDTLSARSDMVFVCERARAGGTPARVNLEWDAEATTIERKVNARAAKGETIVAFWASRMYLNALMAQPVSGSGPPAKYVIDADPLGTPSMTSTSGRLVAWVRYRTDQQVGVYDTTGSGTYDILSDEVPDADWNPTGTLKRDRQLFGADLNLPCVERRRRTALDAWLPCEAWRLRDRLADRARRGERPIEARYHRDPTGRLTLDVILRKES